MPKIEKHNEISEAKERRSTFVLDTAQNDESNDVRNVHVQFCFLNLFIYYCIALLSTRPAAGS